MKKLCKSNKIKIVKNEIETENKCRPFGENCPFRIVEIMERGMPVELTSKTKKNTLETIDTDWKLENGPGRGLP